MRLLPDGSNSRQHMRLSGEAIAADRQTAGEEGANGQEERDQVNSVARGEDVAEGGGQSLENASESDEEQW
jgi:hypothetical protein